MDLTSTKGFFNSVRNPSKNSKQPLTPASSYLPPSSSGSQKKFAPPPMRRLTSDSSSTSTPVPPPPPARKKEEPAGEWAEVLYDFTGDVSIGVFPCKKWLASQTDFPSSNLKILISRNRSGF